MSSQNKIVVPAPSGKQRQDIMPLQKDRNALPISIIPKKNNTSSEAQFTSILPKTKQPVEFNAWNISNVVYVLGHAKKKGLSSAPESFQKRLKTNDNELLRLGQTEDHNHPGMRSELREFMSAVASTLRDIQERLEEKDF